MIGDGRGSGAQVSGAVIVKAGQGGYVNERELLPKRLLKHDRGLVE